MIPQAVRPAEHVGPPMRVIAIVGEGAVALAPRRTIARAAPLMAQANRLGRDENPPADRDERSLEPGEDWYGANVDRVFLVPAA